jgi:hypothetical protein
MTFVLQRKHVWTSTASYGDRFTFYMLIAVPHGKYIHGPPGLEVREKERENRK